MHAININLAQIAGRVADYVDQRPAIDPSDIGSSVESPIIAVLPSGKIDIIDGYHRFAGAVRWCMEHDVDVATVSIACTTGTEEELEAACLVAESHGF